METTNARQEILNEVKQTLGLVPSWVETQPPESLPGFWSLFRDFYLAETKIPNKYKELIGIGVSGATRCRYCALFHTEAARLHGATEEEIAEASTMASMTMLGSTYLNAMQVDYEEFRRETQEIVAYVRAQNGGRQAAQAGAVPREGEPEPARPHV